MEIIQHSAIRIQCLYIVMRVLGGGEELSPSQRRSDRVDLCSLRSLTRVPLTSVPRPVPAKAWGLSGRELPHVCSLTLPRDLLSKSVPLVE